MSSYRDDRRAMAYSPPRRQREYSSSSQSGFYSAYSPPQTPMSMSDERAPIRGHRSQRSLARSTRGGGIGGMAPIGGGIAGLTRPQRYAGYEEAAGGGGSSNGSHNSYSDYPSASAASSKSWFVRHKYLVATALVVLVLLGAGLGAGLGVGLNSNNNTSAATSANENAAGQTSTGSVRQTNTAFTSASATGATIVQPSSAATSTQSAATTSSTSFPLDPNLHQSFYAFSYTPLDTQYPACGANLTDVEEDIKILSQLTKKVRLYGMDCNATDFTLQAIQNLGVDMSVFVSIYLDDNTTTWDRQHASALWTIQNYGVDHIDGVTVGNEVLFNKWIPESELVTRINTVRTEVNAMGFSKKVPVGTSDLGANIDATIVGASDYVMANVHPFFAPNPAATAANWTWNFFFQNDVNYANQTTYPALANGGTKDIPAIISETGWPTQGNSSGGAIPGVAGLQTFLDTFICQSNAMGVPYYFFEAFDEPWKLPLYGELEASWGLFNADKTLKSGITIPNCPVTQQTYWGGFGSGAIPNDFTVSTFTV